LNKAESHHIVQASDDSDVYGVRTR
jgi:hypothetical protein